MADLKTVVDFCNQRVRLAEVADFSGAANGLQFENSGKVTKIGAAVDAGLVPFRLAAERGVDFLIVHHGMFWNPPLPFTGVNREKLKILFDANIAVYGSHLPLDAHPQIGNNALLAHELGLEIAGTFLPHEGVDIAVKAKPPGDRAVLRERLQKLFPKTLIAIEEGPQQPRAIGILTGSGRSALPYLAAQGIDTFITGELKQEHFNAAQEAGLNIYLGGHYATEVFGVRALAAEAAAKFGLPWEFIATECPL